MESEGTLMACSSTRGRSILWANRAAQAATSPEAGERSTAPRIDSMALSVAIIVSNQLNYRRKEAVESNHPIPVQGFSLNAVH